jgi:eukaryotic-like serine/threonine-protein kinase
MSPTITTPAMTQAGMILGTAAYMSPEQAKGRAVDKRSDVWAFGAVLYEMFTGRRAFEGDDVSETLAHILMKEPEWTSLPATVPPAVVTVLRRCLQKDRKQRVRDIGDVKLALEGAFETVALPTASSATSSVSGGRLTWMTSLAAVGVLGMVAMAVPTLRHLRETPSPAPQETRLEITTPSTSDSISFALSPDGRQIVFVASGDGLSRLWLRPLNAVTAQPLAGTEGASNPFWSPDSQSIAFFANSKLKRLDIGSGQPQTLANTQSQSEAGGSWNVDGIIVFAPTSVGPLFRVPASGGAAVAVTKLVAGQTSHRSPQFLPDGRHLLFYAPGSEALAGIYLGSLDSSDTKRLATADASGCDPQDSCTAAF